MKIILKIFKNDLIGIKGSILTIVLAGLYAWFNIFANGDPYANTGNINIAVVNLDKGSDDGSGNTVNMGQSVTDKLKEQTSIGWVFPDSEAAAIEGVKSGKFYAAVVIDADFSSNMYNALTDNFINPSFTYYENEKKNAVAPKITDTAVSTLKTSINETYIKAISEKLLSSIDNSDTQLSADINSGTFVTSLKTLDDNLAGYQDMITSIIKANKKLVEDNNLKAASTKSTDAIKKADAAIDSSLSDMDQTGSSYYQLRDNLQSQIDSITNDIKSLETSAKLATLKDDTDDISADLDNIKSDAEALNKKLDAIETFVKSLPVSSIDKVKESIDRLDEMKSQVDTLTSLTEETIDNLDFSKIASIESDLTAKLSSVSNAIDTVDNTFSQKIVPDLDNILLNIKEALKNAQNLLKTLNETITSTVFDNYKGTIDSMNTSLSDLSDLIGDVREKIATAISDINKASDSEAAAAILAFLNGDAKELATFLSKPVKVDEHYYYQIANYGSSMSPFYSVLAIWVGMTILVSLMKVHVNDAEYLNDARPHQLFWGRYLIFFLLSQLQVLVIVLGDLYLLKIQCLHPFAFWAVAALTGFTFSLLIYSLTISFGDIGKALAVVIMVLQIAGSGGTYPIEALPGFFRQAYIFFPFPYAINAMRECIGGMYHHDIFVYLAELSLFIVVALVIGMIIRKPFIRIMHFIEKRMEDTQMM